MTNEPLTIHNTRRDLWSLDDKICYLNHGSFGATPRSVLAAQQRYRNLMEAAPTVFMRTQLLELFDKSRQALAEFVNANPLQLAFCTHATEATNAVLRSFPFQPGDEVVVTNHGYGGVTQALNFLSDQLGIHIVVTQVPYPLTCPSDVVTSIEHVITKKTKLVIVDHITSPTALIFPVKDVIAACRKKNVPVFIDGAHVPGHLQLNLDDLKPDFYVGNFHKWLCAPKGSAFLYVDQPWTQLIHPLSISHYYKNGFTEEFDWTGTSDFTSHLCFPDSLEWFKSLGGFEGFVERNRSLAFEATNLLSSECGLVWGHPADKALMGCMGAMIVPGVVPDPKAQTKIIDAFYRATGIDIHASVFEKKLLVRFSVQAYNSLADYQHLAKQLGKFDFFSLA